MTEHEGLPVAGYRPESDGNIQIVNAAKIVEETMLRVLDGMGDQDSLGGPSFDRRWLAIARTNFELGFMAMNRAVFQPSRIALPEDKAEAVP